MLLLLAFPWLLPVCLMDQGILEIRTGEKLIRVSDMLHVVSRDDKFSTKSLDNDWKIPLSERPFKERAGGPSGLFKAMQPEVEQVFAILGSDVRLKCSWLRPNDTHAVFINPENMVIPSGTNDQFYKSERRDLLIRNADYGDEGSYECRGANSSRISKKSFKLSILDCRFSGCTGVGCSCMAAHSNGLKASYCDCTTDEERIQRITHQYPWMPSNLTLVITDLLLLLYFSLVFVLIVLPYYKKKMGRLERPSGGRKHKSRRKRRVPDISIDDTSATPPTLADDL